MAAAITIADGDGAWQAARAQETTSIKARIIATNIPGASAISQVGTFLNNPAPPACAHPIPTLFPPYIQPGAVLDPKRILVGSRSNFGAPNLKATVAMPATQKQIALLGMIPIDSPPVAQIPAYVDSEITRWSGVVEEAGLAGTQ